jgi:predicted nucleic acid-binding protein
MCSRDHDTRNDVTLYLADSTIWAGRRRSGGQALQSLFVERLGRGEIATCVPIALEVLTGPNDGDAYVRDWMTLWDQLHWLPLRERATGRALEVQSELALAEPGAQRHSVSHFLIAACAEDAGPDVVLWHWDDDLAAICEQTGQPHEFERARAELATTPGAQGNGAQRRALTRPPADGGAA